MGFAKSRLDDTYYDPDEKYICCACASEDGIESYIFEHGQKGQCDYCDKENIQVCSLELLVPHIDSSIRREYEDLHTSSNMPYDKEDGSFVGSTYDTMDLLQDLGLGKGSFAFVEDVAKCLVPDEWCSVHGIHGTDEEHYAYAWRRFVELVTKKFRYTSILHDLWETYEGGRGLDNVRALFQRITKLNDEFLSTRSLSTDTTLYRARSQSLGGDVFGLKDTELGPPPYKISCKTSNRMSPAGVSFFYGALEKETAIAETVTTETVKHGIGEYSSVRDLTLLDFSRKIEIPSIFDDNRNAIRPELKMLKDFVTEISKPCTPDELLHVEYVPSQVVTEFLRWHYTRSGSPIDGIIYPSAKKLGGTCIVVFANSEECKDNEKGVFSLTKQLLKMNRSYWAD